MYAVAIKGTTDIHAIFSKLQQAIAECKRLNAKKLIYTVHEVEDMRVTLSLQPITEELH